MLKENKQQFVVIGAGLGRTGTSSFKKALEILNAGPAYHMTEVFAHGHYVQWAHLVDNPNDLQTLESILTRCDYHSSCDFPSSVFWKEQLALYPDAKVILTARDPEKWYKSCTDTIFQMMPNHPNTPFGVTLGNWLGFAAGMNRMFIKVIFDKTFHGDWSKENVIKCYNAHNKEVMETCPKGKLLVFEVTEGWAPLCEFLEVPVPDVPFPNVNDTKQFQSNIFKRSMMGYVAVGGIVVGVPLLLALGSKLAFGSFLPPQLSANK